MAARNDLRRPGGGNAAAVISGKAGTAVVAEDRQQAQARRRAEFLWLLNLVHTLPDSDGNAALTKVWLAVLTELARAKR